MCTHQYTLTDAILSITNANVSHSHGYQGWSAKIQIDSKLRDGYNTLDFEHRFDTNVSAHTQSWKQFDWYYDDGVTEPTISIAGEPTLSVDFSSNSEAILFEITELLKLG